MHLLMYSISVTFCNQTHSSLFPYSGMARIYLPGQIGKLLSMTMCTAKRKTNSKCGVTTTTPALTMALALSPILTGICSFHHLSFCSLLFSHFQSLLIALYLLSPHHKLPNHNLITIPHLLSLPYQTSSPHSNLIFSKHTLLCLSQVSVELCPKCWRGANAVFHQGKKAIRWWVFHLSLC